MAHVKGSPGYLRTYDLQKIYTGPLLRYNQALYLVGPGDLVVSPAERRGANKDEVDVVLKARAAGGAEQLFELKKDGRLVNSAGYCLEVGRSFFFFKIPSFAGFLALCVCSF